MGLAWLTPCLPPPDEGPPATLGSAKSVFSRKALVRMQLLKDVVGNDTYQINNKYDSTYAPLPVEEIIRRAEYLINEEVSYDLLGNNCEHFVTLLRYGEGVSEQVGDMGEPPTHFSRHLLAESAQKFLWHSPYTAWGQQSPRPGPKPSQPHHSPWARWFAMVCLQPGSAPLAQPRGKGMRNTPTPFYL